jgi:hypothetical protein
MSFSNIMKYVFYTIAFLYSIYIFYGMFVIAEILFNDKPIPTSIPTSITTETENKSDIYIETTKKNLLNAKITIISLITILFLISISFSFYIRDFIFMCIRILFTILN